MSEVVDHTQQEFWRPPVLEAVVPPSVAAITPAAAACSHCGTEFMIGSHFCHTCGTGRSLRFASNVPDYWQEKLAWLQAAKTDLLRGNFRLPGWLHYLHFHEIKRWIGLPTAPFVSFMIGLGCVAGAIGVGIVYKASNLAEFQAVQMWRIEWLLAATASFVAGILLNRPGTDE